MWGEQRDLFQTELTLPGDSYLLVRLYFPLNCSGVEIKAETPNVTSRGRHSGASGAGQEHHPSFICVPSPGLPPDPGLLCFRWCSRVVRTKVAFRGAAEERRSDASLLSRAVACPQQA